MVDTLDKINDLRKLFNQHNIDAYLINTSDIFLGEYIREQDKRLQWLTNFSGEHTYLLVTLDQAIIFTNGIYELQATQEVDNDIYTVHNFSQFSIKDFLQQNPGLVVGYDAKIFAYNFILTHKSTKLKAIDQNLIDIIWQQPTQTDKNNLFLYDEKYTGRHYNDKLDQIKKILNKHKADSVFITNPYLVSYLFNIRSYDIPNTPVALCYAIIDKTKSTIFCDYEIDNPVYEYLSNDIEFMGLDAIYDVISNKQNQKIIVDYSNISMFFIDAIQTYNDVINDKTINIHGIKNTVEIDNIRDIHIYDGIAVTNCLKFLEDVKLGTISELHIFHLLIQERKKCSRFVMPSFDSIVGFNDHGAIIHYRVTDKSNHTIDKPGILLIDSGGQYMGGTTDITRTLPIGYISNKEISKHYTLVLKGYIALASSQFPRGKNGVHLDALARQYLWQEGLDYQHGTGHGVGNFLCVHEGPHNIGPAMIDVALEPGMIVSIEPGYYKKGEYGIRIESLAVVQASSIHSNYLEFNILTKVPINIELIDLSLLTHYEITWLNKYNQQILDDFTRLSVSSDEMIEYVKSHFITT